MMFIPVIFSNSKTIGSYIIRAFDRGLCEFSHVGIITEDGKHVIESTFLGGGVHLTKIEDFKANANKFKEGFFPVVDANAAYRLAYAELGKKYDLCGAIGLGVPFLGRNWGDTSKFFCSELLAHCSQLFPKNISHRVGVSACYVLTR